MCKACGADGCVGCILFASISIYTLVVVVMFLVAIHLSHLMLGRLDDLPLAYNMLPFAIPLFVAFSVIGVMVMRVVHFIGVETLFHLTIRHLSPPGAAGEGPNVP